MNKNTIIKMTLLIISLAITGMSVGTSGPKARPDTPAVLTSNLQNGTLVEQLDVNHDGKVDLIHASNKGCTIQVANTDGRMVSYKSGCHTLRDAMKELDG